MIDLPSKSVEKSATPARSNVVKSAENIFHLVFLLNMVATAGRKTENQLKYCLVIRYIVKVLLQ